MTKKNWLGKHIKDIHAIGVGISVVVITTLAEFFTKHILKVDTGGSMIYIALGITLTTRIMGVLLRKTTIGPDEQPKKTRKRRRRTNVKKTR